MVKLSARAASRRHNRVWHYVRNEYDLYLMILPMLAVFFLFSYRPLSGLIISFKRFSPFKGIWDSPWIGLAHFQEFFSGPFVWRIVRNTLTISAASLFFGFPAPIILALLLNELRAKKFQKAVQTISNIPHFISVVVVCGMVVSFLSPSSGVINSIIKWFGQDPVYFLAQPQFFVPIYVIMNIWKGVGYNSIVYISSLTSIPDEQYEAARVDGAGRIMQLWHVTLPGLMPTIVVMLLIQLGGILNVGYESIILLYSPGVYEAADVINTYVYRTGILEGRYDYSTAVGLFNSMVSLVIVLIANKISNSVTESGLW